MRILITNDDGINARGLDFMIEAALSLGEVKVVAPDRERSACGHSMTLRDPLRVRSVGGKPCEALEVNGLPVDCVNVGLTVAWPEGCDLVLSGINNGPNLGFDVTYSGTVGGAMEGCINGIPSIAVSMALFVDGAPLHFETGLAWLKENLETITKLPFPQGVLYNINIPAIAHEEIQGHRFTRMGKRVYEDRVERREDPWGRPYFWQGGVVVMRTDDEETDVNACSNGYVSITPVQIDWTHETLLSELRERAHNRA